MNYYDKTFDLESLNGKSKGYALAKKLNLAGKISLLYVVAYLFISFTFDVSVRAVIDCQEKRRTF